VLDGQAVGVFEKPGSSLEGEEEKQEKRARGPHPKTAPIKKIAVKKQTLVLKFFQHLGLGLSKTIKKSL